MFGIKSKRNKPSVELPAILQPENPINYNSVLDYLVGLSKSDYGKMIKSADIYRDANAKVAKVVGVKDEPTTSIQPKEEVSDDQVDSDLDTLLDSDDVAGDFLDMEEPPAADPKKKHAPDKRVVVKGNSDAGN